MSEKPQTTADSTSQRAKSEESTLRILGRIRPAKPFMAPRPVDLPRVLHLVRRAALTLPAHDPMSPVLRQVVVDLLHSGDRARSHHGKLDTIADVLALDPHSEEAHRDVRAALDLLVG